MSTAPLLTTHGACFGRGDAVVVRDVSIEIHAGEAVALVGPNGSGKTTLLRGLLGLDAPLAGRVSRRPLLRLGYVPQRESLDPWYPLSGFDVALLGTYGDLPPHRRLGADQHRRAREALVRCRADALAGRRYGDLSGGERQRVLLARALASAPDLLILDEPTAGVDPEAEEAILAALDGMRRERSLALWVVTHRPEALRGRVERWGSLREGALVMRETP